MDQFYKDERHKIEEYVDSLMVVDAKKKLNLSLTQLKVLDIKKKKLDFLQESLIKHITEIEAEIEKVRFKVKEESSRETRVEILAYSLKKLMDELNELRETKKEIVQKEDEILKLIADMLEENKSDLENIDKESFDKFNEIVDSLRKKVDDEEIFMDKQLDSFLEQKNLFDFFSGTLKSKVYALNRKLFYLKMQKYELMKRTHMAGESKQKLKQRLMKLEQEEIRLEKEFNDIIVKYGGVKKEDIQKAISKYIKEV